MWESNQHDLAVADLQSAALPFRPTVVVHPKPRHQRNFRSYFLFWEDAVFFIMEDRLKTGCPWRIRTSTKGFKSLDATITSKGITISNGGANWIRTNGRFLDTARLPIVCNQPDSAIAPYMLEEGVRFERTEAVTPLCISSAMP